MAKIQLGGKDPEYKKMRERASMPSALVIMSKADEKETPDTAEGSINPEEANFHDQAQTCSNCEYFDGADGGGVCTKGVQVDFAESDPTKSWCSFWEQGESVESPEEEAAEVLEDEV